MTKTLLNEFQETVAKLSEISQQLIAEGQAAEIADSDIADTLYVAARTFAAKSDRVGKIQWPITEDALNATETVVLVNALLDAADVNLFDMAIWYRRAE